MPVQRILDLLLVTDQKIHRSVEMMKLQLFSLREVHILGEI